MKMKPSFFAAPFFIISILFLQQISFADAQKGEIEKVSGATDPRGIGGSLKRFVIKILRKAMSRAADSMKDRCPEAYIKIVRDIEDAIEQLRNGEGPKAIGSVMAAIIEAAYCIHSAVVIVILKIALRILRNIT